MCLLSFKVYAFILEVTKLTTWSCVGTFGCVECIGISAGSDVELHEVLGSICQNNYVLICNW